MRIKFFTLLALSITLSLVSCSKNQNESLRIHPSDNLILQKDEGSLFDKIKGFLKKKVRVDVEFGHPEPNAAGDGSICVYRGICKAEVELELGIATNAAGGYDLNGDFLFMFEKATMGQGDLDYHFDNNQFDLVTGITIGQAGIYQGTADHVLNPGIYDVVYEDSEVIVVNFK